ncbi:GNAT family N-acetyltransferase [Planomicrobium sp. YIM 101495]|uniref:GNAT family N-acetyltransferase n=1 Tax=Planomicrobium sp. YIM 101495 TaxID=2665160 RepID=UPI0012B8B187|nr:GNAT family N-acetyltransferase [Planomicrobium sp. YIM 101495]MTD30754.1 GNAT family N-acetyltransferase [Planomicrobium sp. YIM 101495]
MVTVVPDIYFLPEWGKFFESKEKDGVLRIFELNEALGHVYYPFILREISVKGEKTAFFDTITPYGFSGPVILRCAEGRRAELVARFDASFGEYCTEHRIVTEYVRFNPWIRNLADFEELYELRDNGHTLWIDLTVGDVFMDEFSPKARTQVRKARKQNVEIEFDYTGATAKEFHRLYELMARKNGVDNAYYLFSEAFLRDSFDVFGGKQFFINAKFEGNYISSSLVVHHGDYMHYHLTGNDPAYYHLAANSLILHEACRWGVEQGKKEVHLGGGNEVVIRFKRGFTKTEPLKLLMGKRIRDEAGYAELVAIRERTAAPLNKDFFPLYRG